MLKVFGINVDSCWTKVQKSERTTKEKDILTLVCVSNTRKFSPVIFKHYLFELFLNFATKKLWGLYFSVPVDTYYFRS